MEASINWPFVGILMQLMQHQWQLAQSFDPWFHGPASCKLGRVLISKWWSGSELVHFCTLSLFCYDTEMINTKSHVQYKDLIVGRLTKIRTGDPGRGRRRRRNQTNGWRHSRSPNSTHLHFGSACCVFQHTKDKPDKRMETDIWQNSKLSASSLLAAAAGSVI